MGKCKRWIAALMAALMMLQMNTTAFAQEITPTVTESIGQADTESSGDTLTTEPDGENGEADDPSQESTEPETTQETTEPETTQETTGEEDPTEETGEEPEDSEEEPEDSEDEEPEEDAALYADFTPVDNYATFDELQAGWDALAANLGTGIYSDPVTNGEDADKTITSVKLLDSRGLILLSYANPEIYRNAAITVEYTGADSDLTQDVQGMRFQGLGSADVAFAGTLTYTQGQAILINRPLFNNVALQSASTFRLKSNGDTAAFSEKLSGNGQTLTLSFDGNGQALTASLLGDVTGGLTLNLTAEKFTAADLTGSSHAGVLANTLSGNLNVEPANVDWGASVSVTAEAGDAGLLVGHMESGAALSWPTALDGLTAQITASGNAGALIGYAGSGAAVSLCAAANLGNITVSGDTAGGFIGAAENLTLNAAGEITPAEKVTGKTNAGGLFGDYTTNSGELPGGFVKKITNTLSAAGGNAGGLFGTLRILAGGNATLADYIVNTTLTASAAGGVAGAVRGNGAASTLNLTNATVTTNVQNTPTYNGGLVGVLGGVCTDFGDREYSKAQTNVNNAMASAAALDVAQVAVTATRTSAASYGFGGIAGCLGSGSVLRAGSLTVSTGEAITTGGGVVGYAQPKGVVRFAGDTDLSGVTYAENDTTAQLIGRQRAALIFAQGNGNGTGWTYRRGAAAAIDDIGGYGEVIRLGGNLSGNLITLDENNGVVFSQTPDYSGGITVSSTDEFALLAIAMQSIIAQNGDRGDYIAFCADTAHASSLLLRNKVITFTGDVNLTGTGITGLNRDNGTDPTSFFGTIQGKEGSKPTITLAIGEAYGLRDGSQVAAGSTGSGMIYRHNRLGLLGDTWRDKTISDFAKNLKIGGVIYTAPKVSSTEIGGLAARSHENACTVENVEVSTEIHVSGANCYVGGFFGYVNRSTLNFLKIGFGGKILYGNGVENSTLMGGLIGRANAISADTNQRSWNSITNSGRKGILLDDVTISGSIEPETGYSYTKDIFRAAGLIAVAQTDNLLLNVKKLTFDGFTITSAATNSAGGLLGYQWDNAYVYFNDADGKQNGENFALTVTNAKVACSGTAKLGGLVYQTCGYWEINKNGIDLSGGVIDTKAALGLLIYHGDMYSNKALYLNMTANWEDAYKLAESVVPENAKHDVFDEIVAYTASSREKTIENGQSVVSLRTTGEAVNMTGGARNTYENRTAFGKNHPGNPNSRYYYNLAYIRANLPANTSGVIDTPQELMLWSVYRYAYDSIRSYFSFPDQGSGVIGGGSLDMDGYSYYPIRVADTSLTVRNTTITFHNLEIETLETGNKSTKAANRSQHYTMHGGLFLSYTTGNNSPATLTVSEVTFSGSVGGVEGSSGALICGRMTGQSAAAALNVSLQNVTLEKLSVNDDLGTNVRPMFIGSVETYTTLNVTTLNGKNLPNNAATSLIGNVGNENAAGLNLTFSGIQLPDTQGAFTHATLLESLVYKSDTCSAVYNFNLAEDWNGTNYLHQVTYGKEISGSLEYENQTGKQKWYYDKAEESADDGLVTDKNASHDFSGYLPYVSRGYNAANNTHEIKVNHRTVQMILGCGTYSDPYIISTGSLLAGVAAATKGVKPDKIQIANASAFCTGGEHRIYSYDAGSQKWVAEGNSTQTLTDETVQAYIRNAYYQITADVVVESDTFQGFGTKDNPFRGVIVGKKEDGTTPTVTITKWDANSNTVGLIPYSFGSVVKDLQIDYNVEKTISYVAPNKSDWNMGIPKSFFGGAIGCVLGGDNILDNVSVSVRGIALGVTKSHLIPTGGYVGAITGGGVIFRTAAGGGAVVGGSGFYHNPYVGRVLDGYAFSEGCRVDNGDANYKVNQIPENSGLSYANNTVTVESPEALLLLSAIVNSGAGGKSSVAYLATGSVFIRESYAFGNGGYGKSRTARYSDIGTTDSDNADYLNSQRDDTELPKSYLLSLVSGDMSDVCRSATSISLKNDTIYDMTGFGTGYQSIGARYRATAMMNSATTAINYGSAGSGMPVRMRLSNFNGNGGTITVNQVVKEYNDDDFCAISLGGIFNSVGFLNDDKVKASRLTLKNCVVKLEYYDEKAGLLTYDKVGVFTTNNAYSRDYTTAVGGFAGKNAGNGNSEGKTFPNYIFEEVTVSGGEFAGPFVAATLVGSTGVWKSQKEFRRYSTDYLMANEEDSSSIMSLTIRNCIYSGVAVTAGYAAGGFAGFFNQQNNIFGGNIKSLGGTAKIISDNAGSVVGENSTIQTVCQGRDNFAGGAVAVSTSDISLTGGVFSGNTVQNAQYLGGLVGWTQRSVTIENVTVQGTEGHPAVCTGAYYAGGMVGVAITGLTLKNAAVSNVTVTNNQGVTKDIYYAGGIVGQAGGLTITGSQVTDTQVINQAAAGKSAYVGGVAARVNGNLTVNATGTATTTIDSVTLEISNEGITDQNKQLTHSGGVAGVVSNSAAVQRVTVRNLMAQSGQFIGGVIGTSGEGDVKTCTLGNITVSDSHIGSTNQSMGKHAIGGILGQMKNPAAGAAVSIRDCVVKNSEIASPNGNHTTNDANSNAGGMMGEAGSHLVTTFQNCLVEETTVTAVGTNSRNGGSAGGLLGGLYSQLRAGNIRIKNVTVSSTTNLNGNLSHGYLIGKYRGQWDNNAGVYVAGLSVQKKENAAELANTDAKYPELIGSRKEGSGESAVQFIAMADYTGRGEASGNMLDSDKLGGSDAKLTYTPASPYATTGAVVEKPPFNQKSGGGTGIKLTPYVFFGDGMTQQDGTLLAKTILEEKNGAADTTRYCYQNADSIFLGALSTFNANNGSKLTEELPREDFPVLQVSGDEAAVTNTIKSYLDAVTNGGYSNAVKQNAAGAVYVTASVDTLTWDSTYDTLTYPKNNPSPSLKVNNPGSANLSFSATGYHDNDNARITLLTVDIRAAAGSAETYRILVPLVVRRVLQVKSVTTLNYGTPFDQSVYQDLGSNARVLESAGNTITALLTYTYNIDDKNQFSAYGWDAYLAIGKPMKQPNKTLVFDTSGTSLPVGTQLTLVDLQNGNLAYSYKVTQATAGNTKISFHDFRRKDGTAFAEKWLSETLGALAQEDDGGAWVADTSDSHESAGVKIEEVYYRPATDTEKADENIRKYTVTVPESSNNIASENYYLVLYIPKNSVTSGNINGALRTEMSPDEVQTKVNAMLRPENAGADNHSNTASTFNIDTGYSQSLADKSKDSFYSSLSSEYCQLEWPDSGNAKIQLDVRDTVSASKTQLYNTFDQLYYQMQILLKKTQAGSGTASATSNTGYIPQGVQGSVSFYVYIPGDNGSQYYSYQDGSWTPSEKTAVAQYTWPVNGDTKRLILSRDGTQENAISLAGIRAKALTQAKGTATEGKFVIQAEMTLNMPQEAYKEIIQLAQEVNGQPNAYTTLQYRGVLAATRQNLAYSSMTSDDCDGTVNYWRKGVAAATIVYNADDITKLGINCTDLSAADGNISTTGSYDLSSCSEPRQLLDKAEYLVITLNLEQRQKGGAYAPVADGKAYFTAAWDAGKVTETDAGYQWSISKTDWQKLQDTDTSFRIPIAVRVNTAYQNLMYANYRLCLSAYLADGNGTAIEGTQSVRKAQMTENNPPAFDYVTYTITRILLSGLPDPKNP